MQKVQPEKGTGLLRLRRITTGASWIPQVDGLRFAAIAAVVLFHLGGEVSAKGPRELHWPTSLSTLALPLSHGDRGVVLFFVISGYILARPFLRQHRLGGHPVELGKYFLRRLTRLEPPYILSLLLYMAAECAINHESFRHLLPHLIASLFYVHNIVYARMSDISFVTWSLEIEVQFYILAPLLGNLYRVKNTALRRVTIAVLAGTIGFLSLHVSSYLHGTLLGYGQYFLAGFLLADLLEYPRHTDRQSWAWDLVSLAGWVAVFCLPATYGTLAWLPVIIVPVYVAAFRGKASNWLFRQPFVALTGGMCYSIYLMHMVLISGFFRLTRHVQFASDLTTILVQMAMLFPMVLIGGAVYFVLVERPCMDPAWPQKLWRKLRSSDRRRTGEEPA